MWEDLARASVPHLALHDIEWNPALPWWGPEGELDVVAQSVDGKSLLLGSVQWEEKTDLKRVQGELSSWASKLPCAEKKRLFHAVWARNTRGAIDPESVMNALRI